MCQAPQKVSDVAQQHSDRYAYIGVCRERGRKEISILGGKNVSYSSCTKITEPIENSFGPVKDSWMMDTLARCIRTCSAADEICKIVSLTAPDYFC